MFERLFYSILHGRSFRGKLEIISSGTRQVFGQNTGDGRPASLRVLKPSFFRRVIMNGDAGFGEAFFLGEIESDDLAAVLDWFIMNSGSLPGFRQGSAGVRFFELAKALQRFGHRLRRNTKLGSRRNIREHYDVSNSFYRLWLDPSLAYSAAIFGPGLDLETAQKNKFRTICEIIGLKDSDHLLEIGCGWGGFAAYAAENYGCQVTAITISKEQYDYASRLVALRGLDKKVSIMLEDYRDTTGTYDKIVSIEMMEALGHSYVPLFVRRCDELLKPGGKILLQCITYPDEAFASYLANTDFIRKHIFPGGELISLGHLSDAVTALGNLRITSRLSLGRDYELTLRAWREKFVSEKEAILALGFDERFYRKWLYYFYYCESGFRNSYIDDYQIGIEKTSVEIK